MGLAPYRQTDPVTGAQNIYFNNDGGHIFTALLYIVAFITITEGAFVVGKWKFHTREEGNNKQATTMIVVMVLAFISILGTGWAGGQVVASTLGFLTEFKEIPPWAQEWAVRIIPTLFGVYTVLFTIYWLSSQSAQMERIANQERETQLQDHKFTMQLLELATEEDLLVAEAEKYIDLVRQGKLSLSEARAAQRAQMSIPQLEEHLGRDLDDDNKIGRRPMLPDPAEAKTNNLPWQCEYCGNRNPGKFSNCLGCGAERGQEAAVYAPVFGKPQARPIQEPKSDPDWTKTPSRRGSILPWECPVCDNWYVSDSCPRCGTVAPELIPTKRNNGINP
jgi:hypothetical protein